MKRIRIAIGVITLSTALVATAQQPYVYPAKGQSQQQQMADTGECQQWAKQTTGVDPMQVAQQISTRTGAELMHAAEAERATLDTWAREQDTKPWLRFSTVEAQGADPRDNTEAVGDDDAVKTSRVYVDTRAGALKEAGDITQPLKSGALKKDAVRGDLFELCRGTVKGRTSAAQITLFKSVGTAIEDLAAAMLVWQLLRGA